jgi:hypothetical protein
MIPTMVVIGLLVGILPRPWHVVGFGLAVVAWPPLLVQAGSVGLGDVAGLIGAGALAALNVAIGAVVTRRLLRLPRRGKATASWR